MMFVVEDNDYGISSPTRKINPLRWGCFSRRLDRRRWDDADVYDVARQAIEGLRAGKWPVLLWVKMERLSSTRALTTRKSIAAQTS